MTLDLDFERLSLELAETFTIARGSTDVAENVVVTVTDTATAEGPASGASGSADAAATGIGAAAPSRHYGETAGTVKAVLPDMADAIADLDPRRTRRVEAACERAAPRNPAAQAAVSIAVHDLVAKRLDVPLYALLGVDPAGAPDTSFTIGLDEPERVTEKAAAAVDAGYDTLKVKLGTDRDRELVDAVRAGAPDATLRVDANEAWTPKEAVRKTRWLADEGVEFVEQPVPASTPEGLGFVYERSPLPIAVDESCVVPSDVPQVAGRADIVTCKLMKCGGVQAAMDLFAAARAHGLETMLGCMVESNAAISAGAHLAGRCDYVDLDGSLLTANDPYAGPVQAGGAIECGETPGTGARPLEDAE